MLTLYAFGQIYLLHFKIGLYSLSQSYNPTSIIMDRLEFEGLELQVQQSVL